MRTLLGTLGFIVLSAGLTIAQAPAPATTAQTKAPSMMAGSASDDALVANERKMFAALEKNDADAFKALVTADGMSADANGFMKISDFLPMIATMKMTDWKINDPHVIHVDANPAIVTYTWTGMATMGDQTFDKPTYISTVWAKRGGKWLAVYHQETEAAPKK
jgi:hypothetical protein